MGRALAFATALLSFPYGGAEAQRGADEQRIRAARAEFNAAIARRDLPGILTLLEEDFRVSTSSGELLTGRQAMADAFAARFAQFRDTRYVRTPDSVDVSTGGASAAETGTWVGSWTTPAGPFRTGGRYAASWRKSGGRWLLHAELYVPLFCEGAGCT